MGLCGAGGGTRALCAPPPGGLLAVRNPLWGIRGSQRVHRGGGAAGRGTASRRVPRIRTQIAHPALEIQIIDNPSAGNYEELGELCLEQKQYAKAREAFDKAIAARGDSPHAFYNRAKCNLGLGELASAIPDLEHVVKIDPKFDYYRATGLLADAYARTGQLERAAPYFAEATQFSTTPETLYNYANFLRLQNRAEEAREWTQKKTPGQKANVCRDTCSEWNGHGSAKGKTLLKELTPA